MTTHNGNTTSLVGFTPLVRLMRVTEGCKGEVWVKCEFLNLTGSVEDRVAVYALRKAEEVGELNGREGIVVPMASDAAISLAAVGSCLGYRVLAVVPEVATVEEMMLVRAYGADIYLVPGGATVKEILEKAKEKAQGRYLINYLAEEIAAQAYYETIGEELQQQLGSEIAIYVDGMWTGTTLLGAAKRLKEINPNVRVVAVELSPFPPCHASHNRGCWVIRDETIPNSSVIDEQIRVTEGEAINMARRLAKEEGLFVGVRSGANVTAAVKLARAVDDGAKIVTLLPDRGDRFLCTGLGAGRLMKDYEIRLLRVIMGL